MRLDRVPERRVGVACVLCFDESATFAVEVAEDGFPLVGHCGIVLDLGSLLG